MRYRILFALAALLLMVGAACAEEAWPDDPAALAALGELPVIDIRTDSGAMPDDEGEIPATLTRYRLRGSAVVQDAMRISIKVRGNTSKRYPKQSYRIKVVDAAGEKLDVALADGLRSDDDWILNPMYTDTSKIRETLAYRLWEMMNSSGLRAASSRIEYAEVYLNGEYWGLYGVQERIDRKQVDASKRFDVLYKVAANFRPTVQELLDCESEIGCQGFELAFVGNRVHDAWEPAAAYMALLSGEENPVHAAVSLENAIDYGLFAMLAQAHDCHFKNQYLNCVYTTHGYVMYKLPWDLNNTFGDIYQNDREDINYTNYAVVTPIMDCVFEVMVNTGDEDMIAAIQKRWRQLRSSCISQESLMALAHSIYEPLRGAIDRDSLRWPEGGMGEGNAVNIRDLDDYFREVIPRMDAWVQTLSMTEGE